MYETLMLFPNISLTRELADKPISATNPAAKSENHSGKFSDALTPRNKCTNQNKPRINGMLINKPTTKSINRFLAIRPGINITITNGHTLAILETKPVFLKTQKVSIRVPMNKP
jgi:hypothetical protein|tara:strand:- start:342 stop:683 length:342 start_codon:yes stop_codon:yes gene_type:complete